MKVCDLKHCIKDLKDSDRIELWLLTKLSQKEKEDAKRLSSFDIDTYEKIETQLGKESLILSVRLRPTTEWIKADKCFPDHDIACESHPAGDVWVITKDGEIKPSGYDEKLGFYFPDVTHWAYIQKPHLPEDYEVTHA